MNKEKTLLMIKPDATRKNYIGSIIKFLEDKGFTLVAIKSERFTEKEAKEFYEEHKERVFFAELIDYICGGMIVAICIEGENVISEIREVIGNTDPKKANEGTIRKIFGEDINSNAVHAPDSLTAARREISFFFQ